MKRVLNIGFVILIFLFTDCKNSDDSQPIDPIPEEGLTLQNAFPNLSFSKPLDLQSPDDDTDRIFVVEQGGVIRVFANDAVTSQSNIFLDIASNLVSRDELGLLGLAFHPNYSTNGLFYVTYTPSADLAVVSSFRVSSSNSNIADPTSETILLRIPQPFANHNGGQLAFGPDGYLYIASGDGGSGGDPQGNAQNLTNLLGKILRIDVDRTENGLEYAIPSDNPFVTSRSAQHEIYAYGLRNPWRFSFDVQTDLLWAGDVGQNRIEEIDIIENGGNYGWNTLEGTQCFDSPTCDSGGFIAPIFEYDQSDNDRSITGGYVYRGQSTPSLQGRYIYGDFISGRIWGLSTNLETNITNNQLLAESRLPISSFGTDTNNELYICAYDGNIYKFVEN
ncbi:PQQ-dependent sugar dehydrogenase [Maribacter algarum]|uniref:PQQ-dependent sugar dehydrogenase n=1 Tax=Maribacter algarum (ex Zhang et al. 2020) TaxID=2578118 RepID=A0A5S3PQH3_9FLAO|nr:PQQ-dependent sugar dehydrogenase [Maribacter algarum]TMM55915.1 PQQ-dependent sugar dehydrogenase [Maribacter algarum]